jgi:hypothetical protein
LAGTFPRFHRFFLEAMEHATPFGRSRIQRETEGKQTMPILLWLLGIPIPLIILYLFLR